ncbi:hypothetical protein BH24ACT12_BH24ACT12_21070 [soil metagenome]
MPAAVLHVLERFYDAVPRPVADEHVVGPFSLFVATLAWVHEMTPALLGAARAAGMRVLEQPLLVIDGPVRGEPVQGVKVSILDPDDPRFSGARAAVAAGFEGTGVVSIEPVEQWIAARVRDGLMRVVGAFAGQVPVGGGPPETQRGERADRDRHPPILAPPRCGSEHHPGAGERRSHRRCAHGLPDGR